MNIIVGLVVGLVIGSIGWNLLCLAESKPPSKIHDPNGYKNHYKKRISRYFSGCALMLIGVLLVLFKIASFLSGDS